MVIAPGVRTGRDDVFDGSVGTLAPPTSDEMERDRLPGLSVGQQPAITVEAVSKWYGDIVAVSDVSFGVAPGVTALLGPNGAGKSTVLKMIAGLVAPSSGRVMVAGHPPRGKAADYRRLGLVPEQEEIYPFLTGREFVRFNALLQDLSDPDRATRDAIDLVEMTDAAGRPIGGYSKGMRQRIKVAAALVHDPEVLLLDEPLNGMDPVQRVRLIELMRQLGAAGKTVLVSSHVLVEVERFAQSILVIVNGKLAAAGDYRTIRERIDRHDHVIGILTDDPRRLAASLVADDAIRSVRFDGPGRIVVETNDVQRCARLVPTVASTEGIRLRGIQPADESLTSVFEYLTER
ncbi:MAG: Efflux ABC transporter, ATP-binding protein [uncultured Thermomicrobiales bacterium]|uniref:Efflux ABC transporter, ATP-binding protein n=1 Tax=uncultured Thermomicrobiales bacterium TaxID=1645740 RepID=A0A6J4UU92_9BACT|nr:MAG: Efflux ABC transporter, ATP-binding protein [uncultured Thermomicrobiales bacterium]